MPFRRRHAVAAFCALVLASAGTYAYAAQPTSKPELVKLLNRPVRSMSEKSPSFDRQSVLVKFKRGASATAKDKALTKHGAHSLGAVGDSAFLKVHTDGSAADVVKALKKDPAVETVSLDYMRHITAVPNDYFYASDPDWKQKPYLDTMRVPQAWDLTKGSAAQVIAVVDTGVRATHEDLVGRTVAGYNVLNPKALPNDDEGHGTMVAGIAAANTNNSKGVAGVAWTGRVMPVKVLDKNGNGLDSNIAVGIRWAADHGAKVVNLSLGGPGESPVLHDAVTYATNKGAVVVVAAGNDGDDVPRYPAAYPEVLSVGATDADGYLTDFSSFGSWIDVAAPGFGIVSTVFDPAHPAANDFYSRGDGTSFSAPIVSGIAALVRSRNPGWGATPAAVRAIISKIENTARDAGPRGIDPYYGHGVVDAYAAVGGAWAPEFAQHANLPDEGEPNDVPARAKAFDGLISGNMAVEGDVDWYKYASDGVKPLQFTVAPKAFDENWPANLDAILTVYDKEFRQVGIADASGLGGPETVSFTASAGTYYVKVSNHNGGADTRDYTLTSTAGAAGMFAPYTATAVGSQPTAVAVGDVTGDGRADVVMTTGYSNNPASDDKLWVFAQRANGTLAAPVSYATVLRFADGPNACMALLDVDGDGRQDVALGTGSGVQIFRQTATGLSDAGLLPGSAGTYALVAADMNGDGRTDLVTNGGGTTLLTHQADGTFAASTVTSESSAEIAVGDVDGDGRPDVVERAATKVRVYHQGDAGWTRTEHDSGSTVQSNGLAVGDVTGDGKADVIMSAGGNRPNSYIMVLPQNTAGGLDAAVAYPVQDIPETVAVADMNGDSRLDVVTAHGGWTTVSVLPQTATGTLDSPVTSSIPYSSHYPDHSLALGDINGDQRPDVVISDPQNGLVVLSSGGAAGGEQLWVKNVSTPDFGTDVAVEANPTVTFARPVAGASVTSATVTLVNGVTGKDVPATPAYDAGTNSVTITPSAALQDNTPYRIVVSGLTDTTGAAQAESYSSTFRTVDVAPPAVGGLKATGNGANTVSLSWTNPSITDLDAVIVRMAAGTTPPASPTTGTAVYSGAGSGVTTSGLAAGSSYAFGVWVKDRSNKYSPVQTAALTGTAASITSNTTGPSYGTAVTVSGQVTRADTKAGIAGVPVRLYGRRKGTTTWSLLGTATSSATGAVSLKHTPSWSLDYQWIYRGSADYVGSGSALRSVGVHTVVTGVVSPTAIRLGGSTSFYGLVKPWHGGKTVYLQRYSGGKWTNVASQKLSSTSGYKFVIKPTARGTYTYRVYMPADIDHLYGYGPTRSFTVS